MLTHKILIGKATQRDILNRQGTIIVPAGTVITEPILSRLQALEVELQDIDIIHTPSDAVLIQQATTEVRKIFQDAGSSVSISIDQVQQGILPTVEKVAQQSDIFRVFQDIHNTDEYTYNHCLSVGIISMMIGQWMGISGEELSLLSLSATLHDIGKARIPKAILQKPGRLTAEEYKIIQQHALFGYDILRRSHHCDDKIALVALQHHERMDGKGYPYGHKSDTLHFFSRIVAVADVFHAMSSKRVYRGAAPFYEVLDQIQADRFGKLDPEVVHIFLKKMSQSMENSQVMLSDGRIGKIVLISPNEVSRPLIEVDDAFIDLRTTPQLKIRSILTS